VEYKIEEDNPDILLVTNVLTETGLRASRRFRRIGDGGLDSSIQRRHSVL